ncbi:hypothetical protein [Pseudoalteromonas piscicida]
MSAQLELIRVCLLHIEQGCIADDFYSTSHRVEPADYGFGFVESL